MARQFPTRSFYSSSPLPRSTDFTSPLPMSRYNRVASLLITLCGTIINGVLIFQIVDTWRSFKWETESEWESSGENWRVYGVKVLWALLFTYFSSATAVCAVGFVGIVKNNPKLVRFYRDYSIADFSFCAFSTALAILYVVFHTSSRAGVCEESSRHPELMRIFQEMGLNVENCERYLDSAVFAFLSVMLVIIVLRLHFLLAVSKYYSHLVRYHRLLPTHRDSLPSAPSSNLQRIYFLPRPSQSQQDDVELIYTPVPRSSLPKNLQTSAREAWISQSGPEQSSSSAMSSDQHRHHHRHHRRSSRSSSADMKTGLIRLAIVPDEGLLPPYVEDAGKA